MGEQINKAHIAVAEKFDIKLMHMYCIVLSFLYDSKLNVEKCEICV